MFLRIVSLVSVLGAFALGPSIAAAQPVDGPDKHAPDPAERKAARILADEGLSLFNKGEYQAALGKFEQAEKLVPAPTIALQLARSLDKLGRLLDARERYEALVAEELPKTAPPVMRKAQEDAAAELEALKARIPTMSLTVEGPRGDGVELLIDGRPNDLATFEGIDRAVDPGAKTLELRRRDAGTRKLVPIAEGDHAKIRIVLPPIGSPEDEARRSRAKLMKNIGWGAFGFAGAATIVAVGTGVAAVSTRSQLLDKCPASKCSPSSWSEVDRYNRLRVTTTTALVLGALGGAAGTSLFLLAPREKSNKEPAVQGSFGLGSASLSVSF